MRGWRKGSDAKLIFEKKDFDIKIVSTFSNESIETSFENFQKATSNFYNSILTDILDDNPAMKNNPVFAEYLRQANKNNPG